MKDVFDESVGKGIHEEIVASYAFSILSALAFLSSNRVVHRNMCLENVLVTDEIKSNIKLADYAMFYLTDNGTRVKFVIGDPRYLSPEAIALGVRGPSTSKADIWALGIILISLLSGHFPFPETDPATICKNILTLAGQTPQQRNTRSPNESPFVKGNQNVEQWLSGTGYGGSDVQGHAYARLSAGFREILRKCFEVDSRVRPSAEELLLHPYFASKFGDPFRGTSSLWVRKPHLKCLSINDDGTCSTDKMETSAFCLKHPNGTPLSLTEVFHFWKLSGGDLESELGQLKLAPSIQRIPVFWKSSVIQTKFSYKLADHFPEDISLLYDFHIIQVSLDSLQERMAQNMSKEVLQKSSSSGDLGDRYHVLLKKAEETWGSLPHDELEKDIDYQRHRCELFRELIRRYSSCSTSDNSIREETIRQASIDIPSVLRGEIWSVLLGVREDTCWEEFNKFVSDDEGVSDHQIDLDIPRCHQYNPLLGSPEGHAKMKKILKAWVFANPDMAYWQGLDSVLAPFLALSFNEAKAFCCLQLFVQNYVRNFFMKDNTQFLQNHMLTFRQLLAYHDPELSCHLHNIGFHPYLYAIPWFLTEFTYIFPLEKIFPLWDKILLAPPSFPFFIAIEIMIQLRDIVLPLDFNSCIATFSQLPAIDVERCITDALERSAITPLSITLSPEVPPDTPSNPLPWWKKPLALEERTGELAPRIALQDFVITAEQGLVIDIRPSAEFARVHFRNAINMSQTKPKALPQMTGPVIIIGDHQNAPKFANTLILEFKVPMVSVLTGGIDCIRAEADSLLEFSGNDTSPSPPFP